jgi:hypothetical protein
LSPDGRAEGRALDADVEDGVGAAVLRLREQPIERVRAGIVVAVRDGGDLAPAPVFASELGGARLPIRIGSNCE